MNARQTDSAVSQEERQAILSFNPDPNIPPHVAEGISDEQLVGLRLRYNGYQEGFEEIPGGHLYTRLNAPCTTFMVMAGETLEEAHRRALELFLEQCS